MILFRALWYLILTIVGISILRGVLGFLARLFLNATVGPERRQGGGVSRYGVVGEKAEHDLP